MVRDRAGPLRCRGGGRVRAGTDADRARATVRRSMRRWVRQPVRSADGACCVPPRRAAHGPRGERTRWPSRGPARHATASLIAMGGRVAGPVIESGRRMGRTSPAARAGVARQAPARACPATCDAADNERTAAQRRANERAGKRSGRRRAAFKSFQMARCARMRHSNARVD
ncbi:hypothetical protein E2R23_05730 [Burkholderia pseudomallei]|nr:hypothetical protein EYA82_05765 [Burkholderia pseudomallei]QBP47884.1 hypothetical protein E2R28_05760 [Burkholderia pseudomallei]QBP54506.1 hypothetical protein E2R23_05730 [Burkholderia pseudomallei]QBP67794.1 hypothetical protein E2R25_05785 [Burkholderia pseudomallei]QBR23268.1 hypothetical protein E3O37_05760 [Burkholderia pseudomallei]